VVCGKGKFSAGQRELVGKSRSELLTLTLPSPRKGEGQS